ncbi:MAG TPA: DinB family protein [Armatimonadota bacterium]|jgi:hypothetical protein
MLETFLELLEESYYEVGFAFEGLEDDHVWRRPAEGLLSVGELAGHIAYWEAVKLAGDGGGTGSDLANCRVAGPLIDRRFRYYPALTATPLSEQQLAMTTGQVREELLRVHREAVAHFRTLSPDLESPVPGWPPGFTYGAVLKYASFHVAYHTGQMYSARHLLGEETPEN